MLSVLIRHGGSSLICGVLSWTYMHIYLAPVLKAAGHVVVILNNFIDESGLCTLVLTPFSATYVNISFHPSSLLSFFLSF